MKRDFNLYESEDGKSYAVLVSKRFGSMWSDNDPQIACDKRLVEFWLKHKDDKEFINDILYNRLEKIRRSPVYKECRTIFRSFGLNQPPYFMVGFAGIELVWVRYGEMWRITRSYDGTEELEFFSPASYNCFEKERDYAEDQC